MTEPIQIELPTIFEVMTVNAWLIKGKENVLIDCGEKTDKSWNALNEGLKQNGLSLQDISKVVITHAHLDHLGMANKITQHCDATIWVSEYVYEWTQNLKECLDRRSTVIKAAFDLNLSKVDREKGADFGYKMLGPYWEEVPKERIHVFPMSGTIDLGGQNWEVIHTPGHCINQTCFYQRATKRLLSADMLLRMIPIPIIDATIKPPYKGVQSLQQHLDSYKILMDLDIEKAYPGHLEAFGNVAALMEKQINRIHQRKEKCFQLINSGTTQFMDLIHAIYPKRIHNATMFMVIGFLEILKNEGRIESFVVDDQLQYRVKQEVRSETVNYVDCEK